MNGETHQISLENPRIFGYAGNIIRVDLTNNKVTLDNLNESVLRKYVGGSVLGIKYVYDEVPPGVKWSDPENRLFIGTGPLGGTRVGGSGSICVVASFPSTGGISSTQANGIFGAYLRFNGYDGIILQGKSPRWSYIYIHDGLVELKDAVHLVGKTTWDVEKIVREELGKKIHDVSVLSIGPAADNLVKFAGIMTDFGHYAAHGGVGAVLGSKKIKAIVVERGKIPLLIKDKQNLSKAAQQILDFAEAEFPGPRAEGTIPGIILGYKLNQAPIKNYSTNLYQAPPSVIDAYSPNNILKKYAHKEKICPCWACIARHCHRMEMPEGRYKGYIFEEPEAEGMHEFSCNVGIEDVEMTMILNDAVDRLGFDMNEAGYVISLAIECYEKGVITRNETDGLEMKWGNGEAILEMLNKIACREGFGNILAEGTMRAARAIGGDAPKFALHSMKGVTPRGHDHRAVWYELFETCVTNLSTLESHKMVPFNLFGIDPKWNRWDPIMVSTVNATVKGAMVFEDSLVTCRWNTGTEISLLNQAVNAATGWDMSFPEAMAVGRRGVNLARAFNLRHGIGPELDRPSERYGSALIDGPNAGKSILPHWDKMLNNYYKLMGWDEKTSKPLPETLESLDLGFVIPQLY